MRGDIEELALGQGEGTRGVQSTPAPVEVVGWRARGPRDPKRLGRSSPSPRSGHGWENSIFSKLREYICAFYDILESSIGISDF